MTQDTNPLPWQELVCDDLAPVLRFLQQKHRLEVWKFTVDPQGQGGRLYLRRNLSRKVMAGVREQCANNAGVQFLQDGLYCPTHRVWLLSSKAWWIEQRRRVQGPSWFGAVFQLLAALLLTVGGAWELLDGLQMGDWRLALIGAASVALFGLSAYAAIIDMRTLLRRKRKP